MLVLSVFLPLNCNTHYTGWFSRVIMSEQNQHEIIYGRIKLLFSILSIRNSDLQSNMLCYKKTQQAIFCRVSYLLKIIKNNLKKNLASA